MPSSEFFAILFTIVGLIIGLGAVTVIDLHGLLGTRSSYWTVATTRTHKITKPLIWIGTLLFGIGLFLMNSLNALDYAALQFSMLAVMVLNGLFLTFSVSRFLLAQEKAGKDHEILSQSWQIKIAISFIISVISWWSQVLLIVHALAKSLI